MQNKQEFEKKQAVVSAHTCGCFFKMNGLLFEIEPPDSKNEEKRAYFSY